MPRFRWILCGLLALLGGTAIASPRDAAAAIDRHLAAGWEKAGVKPALPADDAEFLRRVYLDLVGRIPTVTEARHFLDNQSPNKRTKLIEELLSSPHYANHFTNIWRSLLLPEADASLQARFQLPAFEAWLRNHFAANTLYDQMVKELLTAPMATAGRGAIIAGDSGPSPAAFFTAKELMPENLAAATTRVFLGIKLECAQCHNHPFAEWKRDEFWSFAAFFAGIKRQGQGEVVMASREDTKKRDIAIPDTTRTVSAKFLDGKSPQWKDGISPRQTLAEWVTAADNPYFARATVNRLWSYFFGTGLIDPVDEMVGGDAVSSHPELLDELAKAFVDAKFDLKFLVRSIVNSRAYQLSSRSLSNSQDDPHLFARMPLRGLTGEQLFDSIARATSFSNYSANSPQGIVIIGRGDIRGEFLSRFTRSGEKSTDHQTSILQALSLMNGQLVTDSTDLAQSELLAGVLDAPFFDTAGKIETLYLAALSRRPTEKESARIEAFIKDRTHGVKDSEKSKREQEALADLFWSLLNSAEFVLNH